MLLAECAPNDNKWGIGIAVDDPRRFDVKEWTGHNLLGRILMDVRDEMRMLRFINGCKRMDSSMLGTRVTMSAVTGFG